MEFGNSINIYIDCHPGYDPPCCYRMMYSSVSTEAWEVLFHWGISTIFTIHVMWWSCLVYYSAFPLRLFHSKNVFKKTLEWSGLQSFLQSLISWIATNITDVQAGTRPTGNKRWPFCKRAVLCQRPGPLSMLPLCLECTSHNSSLIKCLLPW